MLARLGCYSKPDFIGIGVEKTGTTSMYNYLIKHPDIRHPQHKELLFFDRQYERGIHWYWSRFPLPLPGLQFVTGEISPSYLFNARVPERIAAVLPDVKLIVMLRNPVDRAFSHFTMAQNLYGAPPLEGSLEAEFERIEREGLDWYLQYDHPREPLRYAYVTRGLYARALRRWFGYFPREQFLILRSEEFFADPAAVVAQTLAFLGVDPAAYPQDFSYRNMLPGQYSAPMPADFRQRLREFYRPHNQELAGLLGWDVSNWDQ